MPRDAEADHTLTCDRGGIFMQYQVQGGTRVLRCKKGDFDAEITLTRENPESIVINIPFDQKPTQFYYNHKINCMRAGGRVRAGGKEYVFDPTDSFGLLDWGRGVWPFHNEWFWSNGTGLVEGEVFGFNLGCGFGNVGAATENTLFWRGAAHKLGRVSIGPRSGFHGALAPDRRGGAAGAGHDPHLGPHHQNESALHRQLLPSGVRPL